ncbi:MFS transporter [Subtercola sp. YIM 133946]|uniref:MFS transporter n=1 Tax=Subtercola sp. YIM 133946 TaxID=3118909 RepID=UPI002F95BFA3
MSSLPVGETTTSEALNPRAFRRIVALVTIGNVLEWFDFSVYAVVAVYIAATFFNTSDPIAALLPTFAIFGAAFLARPLGAVVLGRLMDRRGRKSVMLISMFLMAGGSVLIGVAPGYAAIGVAGAVIVVIGRLLQGFSAGGEFGSSAVFLSESANRGRRGFYTSFSQVATSAGLILGLLFAFALTALLGAGSMAAWGWRVPFVFGGILAVVVFVLRRRMGESPAFVALQARGEGAATQEPDAAKDSGDVRSFLLNLGVVCLWTMAAFITLNYMPTYAVTFAKADQQSALIATLFGAALTVVLIPVAGMLSDRFGRRPLLIIGAVGYVVLAYPAFSLLLSMQSLIGLIVFQLIMAPLYAIVAGVGPATITELYGTRRRGSLVSTASAVATALAGGFAPYISTWLIQVTGNTIAPAFYLIAGALVSLVAAVFLPKRIGLDDLRE